MQTMLLEMLNNGIKSFVTNQLMTLDNAKTRTMKTIRTSKIISLCSIQADQTNKIVDQVREENTQLQNQVADLIREVCSMAAAKATTTCTPPPATVTPLLLISDPEVAPAAASRQTSRKQAAGRPIPQPLCALVALRPAPTSTPTLTFSHVPAHPSMARVA